MSYAWLIESSHEWFKAHANFISYKLLRWIPVIYAVCIRMCVIVEEYSEYESVRT